LPPLAGGPEGGARAGGRPAAGGGGAPLPRGPRDPAPGGGVEAHRPEGYDGGGGAPEPARGSPGGPPAAPPPRLPPGGRPGGRRPEGCRPSHYAGAADRLPGQRACQEASGGDELAAALVPDPLDLAVPLGLQPLPVAAILLL